jgi:hypothetical protein
MSRKRLSSVVRIGSLVVALVGLGLIPGWARADSFIFLTPSGSTDSKGDPVDAKAVFTTSNGSLHIELTNLLVNQKDVGQNISDISWHVASGLSSGSLTSSSGLERTVAKGGTFKDGSVVSTGWKLTPGSTWELTGLDGAADSPAHTILGSPSGSKYSNANGSIAGNGPHNPFLAGTVSFDISISGLTASDKIDTATFSFGTTAGDDVQGRLDPAPEPSALLLLGGMFSGLGVFGCYRRYTRRVAP